jgi:DNA-binding transcriptional MerR regulator
MGTYSTISSPICRQTIVYYCFQAERSMTILRTQIETALDELISNEEGMRFQGLAIVLTKRRWPELIASQRKTDLGLDAHAPASIAHDGIGKGLASSLTATLGKIKEDINRFQPFFGDVKILLFATPRKVSKQTAAIWAEAVLKEFGIELIVLPREDIITDLMLPTNASICRSHLRFDVSVEPTVLDLAEKAREAASKIVAQWLAHPRLTGKPRITLFAAKVDLEGKETEEIFELEDLEKSLLESRRIVLEAPAGRGKTTTLIQLAELLSAHEELAILIDLPGWVASNLTILEFIAKMPPFLARSIGASDLARLYESVPFSFLLNGWNEVSEIYSDAAIHSLKALECSFPNAGIIIATRTHQIRPPLPGALRAILLPLNRHQRMDYLQNVLANHADALSTLLDDDRVLDDLTRTPLILAEVTTIFLSGKSIPRTKVGVLAAVMRLIEQDDNHRDHLQRPPLSGQSQQYLSALAVHMTSQGAVSIVEECAQRAVHSVTQRLCADGLIASTPEPAAILSELSAHHVIERLEYPVPEYRFQHQQFQEFYASLSLKQQLLSLIEVNDPGELRRFTKQFLNEPIWEESLRMVAEEVGKAAANLIQSEEMLEAGKRLVELALMVDPIFAADLARLCGPTIWERVRDTIGQTLRAWYKCGDIHHQECALAGMLASGYDDFIDIVIPLITSPDQQIRLTTYRAWREFHVSSLGTNWRLLVDGWKAEQRAEFIFEVVRNSWVSEVAEDFAHFDSSPAVRAAALSALAWVGAYDCIARILSEYNDDEFELVLGEQPFDFEDVPHELRARALVILKRLLQKTEDFDKRLRFLHYIGKAEEGLPLEQVKDVLSKWPSGREKDRNYGRIKSVLELVRRDDSLWVSEWAALRILDGSFSTHKTAQLISTLPNTIEQELLAKIQESELPHIDKQRMNSVLAGTANPDLVASVFSKLCVLHRDMLSIPRENSPTFRTIYRNLEELYWAMPAEAGISGILRSLSSQLDYNQYDVACGLVGRIGTDGDDLRSQIPDDPRQAFRNYLKSGIPFVLREDDFSGELKMQLAMSLARVGDPEDIADLYQLIQADIQRLRRECEARLRGERSRFIINCSNWHVRALEILDPSRAEDILLELLCEPEYEQEALSALIRQAKNEVPEKGFLFKRQEYGQVWKARSGRPANEFDEDRRRRCVIALKQQISTLLEERSHSSNPSKINPRLKKLARALAVSDGSESTDLVVDLARLPGEWDDRIGVEILDTLLHNGAHLGAELVLDIVNPIIEKAISRRSYDHQQADSLLQSCLKILPFVDPPSKGIARIKEVIATTQLPLDIVRYALPALGYSRCKDALDILLTIAEGDEQHFKKLAEEWVDAVAALDTPESNRILQSFVDPDIRYDNVVRHRIEKHVRRTLALHIGDIARRDASIMNRLFLLCGKQHSPDKRLLLVDVIAAIGTPEAIKAGIELISDHAQHQIPYELWRVFERVFLERISDTTMNNTSTLHTPSADEIRNRLFHMAVEDDDRKQSAWEFLGQIELWRLEHGRPLNEPRHPALGSGLPWPPIIEQSKA